MRFLIGIDDTDSEDSRGTGFRARGLGALLAERGLAATGGVSRHQLFVDPRIPYTSHNSSLCLDSDVSASRPELVGACRSYLKDESAPGSDPGLCVAPFAAVSGAVVSFARRAKTEVLQVAEAEELARTEGIHLETVAGDRCGVIGALAAVGLRAMGDDGRFVWVPGVRELNGSHRAASLVRETGIDEVRGTDGSAVGADDLVDVDPWPRPVVRGGRAVLLVQPGDKDGTWMLAPRNFIKTF
jgi:hypothetical protein